MKVLRRLFQFQWVFIIISAASGKASFGLPFQKQQQIGGQLIARRQDDFVSHIEDSERRIIHHRDQPFAAFGSPSGRGRREKELINDELQQALKFTPEKFGSISLTAAILAKAMSSLKWLVIQQRVIEKPHRWWWQRHWWWQKEEEPTRIQKFKNWWASVTTAEFATTLTPEFQCATGAFLGLTMSPLALSVGPVALFEGGVAYVTAGLDEIQQFLEYLKSRTVDGDDVLKTSSIVVSLLAVAEAFLSRIQQRFRNDIRLVAPNVQRGFVAGAVTGVLVQLVRQQRES